MKITKIIIALALMLACSANANAQFGRVLNKVKQKAKDKIERKVDKTIDKVLDGAEKKMDNTVNDAVKGKDGTATVSEGLGQTRFYGENTTCNEMEVWRLSSKRLAAPTFFVRGSPELPLPLTTNNRSRHNTRA